MEYENHFKNLLSLCHEMQSYLRSMEEHSHTVSQSEANRVGDEIRYIVSLVESVTLPDRVPEPGDIDFVPF